MATMPTLPTHAQANRSTVAGNNIFWQVSYQKTVPHHRQIEQAYKYCPICTLPYPCQHVDAKQHSLNTVERWKSYPSNPESLRCVEFDSSGFCTSFATRNCCGFHHETEKKIAEFKIVDGRCKVCTLPSKSRCYIHDPPLGKKLCKADRGIVVDGPNYEERFVVGEIVAVASAVSGCFDMFWKYSWVVLLCVYTACSNIPSNISFCHAAIHVMVEIFLLLNTVPIRLRVVTCIAWSYKQTQKGVECIRSQPICSKVEDFLKIRATNHWANCMGHNSAVGKDLNLS